MVFKKPNKVGGVRFLKDEGFENEMAHKSWWYCVGVSSIFPSLTCLLSLLMGIRPKVKITETKQNKINKNYLLFTSEDDIISTMQESYDKVTWYARTWLVERKVEGEKGSHGKYKTLKKIIQTWNVLRPKSTNRNTNNKKKTNYKHKYLSVTLDTVCIDP